MGTGNFNEVTAKLYTDLALFTAHEGILSDVQEVFRCLVAGNFVEHSQHLLVAPLCLKNRLMELIDQAKDIQTQIDETFRTAYAALQKANMEIGIAFVDQISHTVPVENSIRIKTRSVMGTEIPLVEYDKKAGNTPTYAYYSTKLSLDEAKAAFERVKELSI